MGPPAPHILPVLLLLTLSNAGAALPCPRPCSCPQPSELHCTFRSLLTIPAAISKNVERINLGFNSINQITERSLTDLRRLELLMIHGNNIHSLPDGVFRDLTALQMLKMSYNKLTEINRDTLQGLWSLTRLHLDHNRLRFLHPDSFHGLTSLRMLQLEGNQLQQLHPDTFATFTAMGHFPVSTLKHLYLSDNGLTTLSSATLPTMPQLENLYLHGNPWTCDCNMKWLQTLNQTAPGVLKCKKDRALVGGQLCPACSSPRHLKREELQSVETLECRQPLIVSPGRTTPPEEDEREVLTQEDFKEPLGNISLDLSDDHGNQVDLKCGVAERQDLLKIDWEQVDPRFMVSNVSVSVDLECRVDRTKYERLWRLIAYYSAVPAHLQREGIVSRDPSLGYEYKQDPEKDAVYYTGMKLTMMARPEWLMQTSLALQLNRFHSSPKTVKLTMSTALSEAVELELVRRQRQRRTWVMIESTNTTSKQSSAIVGRPSHMSCRVHSSSKPIIQWMLPDGSKLEAPSSHGDRRLSVASDGTLVINAVSHVDAGTYYCTARVHGDFAVVTHLLTVQDSSSPGPGDKASLPPVEGFVGNPISLPCVTSGSPDAEVSWILPNSDIVHSRANSSKALVHANGTLYIVQPQQTDTGYYKCVAMNQQGAATLAVKVNVLNRKGFTGPLRKLSVWPQSAAGVNTQIQLLRQETEESSAESPLEEFHKTRRDFRMKTPAALPGRQGGAASRTLRRRPPLHRKPMGSRVADRKNTFNNTRRINVSKSKIDPKQWADILAKIRDRSNSVTVTPVTVGKTVPVTTLNKYITSPSDDRDYTTTTQTLTYKPKVVEHWSEADTSRAHTTSKPHATRHAAVATTVTIDGRPFATQTTSVWPHTATFWPVSITPRHEVTNPAQDDADTEYIDGNSGETKPLNENEGMVEIKRSKANQEQPEKHHLETITALFPQKKIDFQSGVILTTVTASRTIMPTKKPSPRHRHVKRKNEGRRKRPHRKKQKVSVTNAALSTTTLSAAAPLPGSQEGSSAPLSHRTNMGYQTVTKPPTAPQTTHSMNSHEHHWAKPVLKSPSAAPLFPRTSPGKSHGKILFESTTSRQMIVATPVPPGNSPEETQKGSFSEKVTRPTDRFPEAVTLTFPTQADVEKNRLNNPFEPSEYETPVLEITTRKTFLEDFMSKRRFTTTLPGERVPKEPYDHSRGSSDKSEIVMHPVTPPPATRAIPAFTTASSSVKTNPLLEDSTVTERQKGPYSLTSIPQFPTHVSVHNPDSTSPVSPSFPTGKDDPIPALVPKITQIHFEPFTDGMITSTKDARREHWPPGTAPNLKGLPRKTENGFQTFTVKAEADVQLPCAAPGQPTPTLSWTKASTGEGITPNTTVSRFEVHSNGTLIIRKAQLLDQGRYLCTVQNQYGTDKMMYNLVVLSQHPRILHPQHRDVTVPLGGSVTVDCKVEGYPNPEVTWILPTNIPMTFDPLGWPSQRRVAALNNGTLHISHALYSDRGTYRCIGNNTVGADWVTLRLDVSALPPVIQQILQENISYPEGSNVYIHCSSTGAPPPVIRWLTPNGLELVASQVVTGHNVFVLVNGTLFVRGLNPGNAGRYECTASNAVASSQRIVILNATKNPFLSKASITSSSPQRTEVAYGSKLQLNCIAKGEPEPRIIWRTPSKKLADAQYSFDPRIKVFTNGSITIHSMRKEDGGDYLCVARNKMGDDYVLFHVIVLTRAAKIQNKQPKSTQEVAYGGELKVDCMASGFPIPKISWALPDGTTVALVTKVDGGNVGHVHRFVVFDNGTLYFKDVGLKEEGDYICYAENQLGKDMMKVTVKVTVPTSSPQILDKDHKSVKVPYGERVTLKCTAKGEPAPVISWLSPTNRVISPSLDKYQVLDDGTLVVQKAQRFDGGNYTCIARNSAGHDYKTTRLEVWVIPPVINGLQGDSNAIKVTALQEQTKWLDCVAKGIPAPRIMWVLPGNVVLPAPYSNNRMIVHLNGSLEIRAPQKTDSGQLVCIARNEGGEVKLLVTLDVEQTIKRPQTRGPKSNNQSLTIGNTMTLNCSFEGRVIHHITWILPGGTHLQSGVRFSKFFHHPNGSLIISNPSAAESGMYRCLGQNFGRFVERAISLYPSRRPEINNRYSSPISIMTGETLLLHCQTSAEPLRLSWTLPSGVILSRSQRAGRYAILPNGTLAIQQVSVYDRGSYVCRVSNEYGSSVLTLSVIVMSYPPRITKGPPSVTYAKRGVAVQLNCLATGIPKADVAWETPDKQRLVVTAQPRLFGNKYLHPQGSLIIQNPTKRDAGIYRCTARNAIGTDSKTTFLNVF